MPAPPSPRQTGQRRIPASGEGPPTGLAGTIPADVLENLAAKKARLLHGPLPAGMTAGQRRVHAHKLLFADYDRYLDGNRTIDWLARPDIAALIRRSLYFHNGRKYHLLAYCVMPNHVHLLATPLVEVSKLTQSLKRFTAREGNRILGVVGQPFWQDESFDRLVRGSTEFERIELSKKSVQLNCEKGKKLVGRTSLRLCGL